MTSQSCPEDSEVQELSNEDAKWTHTTKTMDRHHSHCRRILYYMSLPIRYFFSPLWKLSGKRRDFEGTKTVVDTFGVVSALLLYIPIEAILRYDFRDWDYYHELVQVCHPDNDGDDVWSFVNVLASYKYTALFSTSMGLMVIIGVLIFSVLATEETAKRYAREVNVFLIWIALLVAAQMVSVIILFEYFFEVFSTDSAGICDTHAVISDDQIEHGVTFLVAAVFPLLLFTGVFRSECFSIFNPVDDMEEKGEEGDLREIESEARKGTSTKGRIAIEQ